VSEAIDHPKPITGVAIWSTNPCCG
jgi:hypothetical protein